MDDYSASRDSLEKLFSSVQAIKQNLVCSICLEYFDEPITIKCGHKFCRQCILRVAGNDNATCPFCNVKIHKRSIPKEGNEFIKKLVKQFIELATAIESDSGINVLEPSKKKQHTKESTPLQEKSGTSKFEHVSNSSKESSGIKSKTNLGSGKKLSLKKKVASGESKSSKEKSNTLHRYLSNNKDFEPNPIHPQEKVSNWLKNVESNDSELTNFTGNDSPRATKLDEVGSASDILLQPRLKENKDASVFESQPSTSGLNNKKVSTNACTDEKNEEPKFKEIQMRLQQAEKAAMAKKNKLNQSIPEKTVLRTPSSVPANTHSDHCDWRRVKRVGKEMQVKTFKSLSVSIEKNSPSVILDDTVPLNSTNNDSKNFSRESDSNSCSLSQATVIEAKRKEPVKTSDTEEKDKHKDDFSFSYKQCTQDSSLGSQKADVSLSGMDQKQLNEIIGITVQNTPEKARNCSNTSKEEHTDKVNHGIPYKIPNDEKIIISEDESSSSHGKQQDAPPSPSKKKLSLKMKLTPTAKPSCSQYYNTTKTNKKENQSPEKSKSRLSLHMPSKFNEQSIKLKSPSKGAKNNRSSKTITVTFKKLGKICKKSRKIPFFCLGKMKPKDRVIIFSPLKASGSAPVIKSNIQTNLNYRTLLDNSKLNNANVTSSKEACRKEIQKIPSPAKDSRSKFSNKNVLPCQQDLDHKKQAVKPQLIVNESNRSTESMEIDEILPQSNILKCRLDKEKEIVNNIYLSDHKQIENHQPCTTLKEKRDNSIKPDVIEHNQFISNSPDIIKTHDIFALKSQSLLESDKVCDSASEKNNFDFAQVGTSRVQEDIPCNVSEKESGKLNSSCITLSSKDDNIDGKSDIHNSEVDSAVDSDSSSAIKPRKLKKSDNRVSVSSKSSSIKSSPVKKKRLHSESSSDEERVTSILGKWYESKEEQVSKKPKINTKSRKTGSKMEEPIIIDSEEHDTHVEQNIEVKKPKRDSQIDDIITKVKSFNENETSVNKVANMPSSLLSTDLFESNDQHVSLNNQSLPKQPNRIITHESPTKSCSSGKESDRENNESTHNVMEATIIDSSQFNKKKANLSIDSDSSNKENNEMNNVSKNATVIRRKDLREDQEDEIRSSQSKKIKSTSVQAACVEHDSYQLPESLLNITQDQVNIKNIEKDLFGGVDLSVIDADKNKTTVQPSKTSTPIKKTRSSQASDNTDDFDSDNIKATPVTKKRQLLSKFNKNQEEELSDLEMSSPLESSNYISAVTPFRRRRSKPLCHSTPMMSSPSPEKFSSKKINLICSGLTADDVKIVQDFVKKFSASFSTNFNVDVTHVIVQTDPETQAGQKTFKYIQGIAYKKYVISFQWIVDCLTQNKLLDETHQKYDVLDPDILESGSKKSLQDVEGLFKGFAFYCVEPFTSITIVDFKSILLHNGAAVVDSPKTLSQAEKKIKIVITESETLSQRKVESLKRSGGAIVSFEWIVDTLSQYHILSLVPYLVEMTVEEAKNLGIPDDYLEYDETLEGEEVEEDL